MFIIPKTFEGAIELEEMLHSIKLTNPNLYAKINVPFGDRNRGFNIPHTNRYFDFSALDVGGIKVSHVSMHPGLMYSIQVAKGNLGARINMNINGFMVRHERSDFIEGFNLTRNHVEKTLYILAYDLSSRYDLKESQILNVIEALWQEGYQFDEYLPGFVDRGVVNIDYIMKAIERSPKNESKILDMFKMYWMSAVVLRSLDDLWMGVHLVEASDYDDFVVRFVDMEAKFMGVLHNSSNGIGAQDLEALYSVLQDNCV